MRPHTVENAAYSAEKIIDCAARLFKKHGYKKTTVDEIAASLSISKKTLYAVFPAKDVILAETSWRDIMNVMAKFRESLDNPSRPEDVLLSLCRYIFTDRLKRQRSGLFWGLYSTDPHIVSAYMESLARVIKEIYQEGRRTGIFKPIDSDLASDLVLSIVITTLERYHTTEEPVRIFNDALSVVADSVAHRNRITFDVMG